MIVGHPAFAVGTVLISWWLSTGIVMLLNGLPRSTFKVSLGILTVLAVLSVPVVVVSSEETSDTHAYVAFGAALMMWAWHELAFLQGSIGGPRTLACPPGARGLRRFRLATATLIHHEVALFANLLCLIAVTWGSPNQVASVTFGVLWVMRLSSKFNLFVGVPYVNVKFIPAHMQFLVSYFGPRRLSAFLPLSLLAVLGIAAAATPVALSSAAAIGTTLVATMVVLGVVEHAFFALPIADAVLWGWAHRPTLRADSLDERSSSPPRPPWSLTSTNLDKP
jgi:putative photosynthetic complex assembly protein 2